MKLKHLRDLNDGEILALTPESIRYYKDLRLAEDGWARPGDEPVKPAKPPVATKTVYRVKEGNYNVTDISFRSAEAAMDFIAMDPWIIKRDWSSSTDHAQPLHEPSVMPEQVAEKIEQDRETLKAYQRELKRYQDNLKEYKETLEAVGKIDEEIDTLIEDARHRVRSRGRIRETYEDFLLLAQGSEVIAMSFLRKKHTDEQILDAGIEPCPPMPMQAPAPAVEQ